MLKTKSNKNEYIDAYLDYYSIVYSSIYTRINNKDEANDLCQEVFIIFYEKFDFIQNKRKWLLGTAKNVLLNYYKKKKPVNIEDIEKFDDMGLTFVNGFRETRILIDEAMKNIQCDDIERMLLDLIAIHNFSYNKTAKIVGLTGSQVKYKYRQLVKKLTHYMRSIGIDDLEDLL